MRSPADGKHVTSKGKARSALLFLLVCILMFLAGCSSRPSTEYIRSGLNSDDFPALVEKMQKAHEAHKEFVTALNLARVYQLQGRWRDSITAYEMGLEILEDYEGRALISMRELLGDAGSILISRGSAGYYGTGYERTLLHTLNSLNYLMLGDYAGAAVEMRRMEERQEVWLQEQEYRLREYLEKRESQETDDDFLPSGYSMTHMLDSPEVRALASTYQDAFSYSLSSIVCRIAGDKNYAEVSMRRAAALNPGAAEMFGTAWASKNYTRQRLTNKQEVVVLVFSGLAPSLRMEQLRVHAPYVGYIMIDLPSYVAAVEPKEPSILLAADSAKLTEADTLRPYPLLRTELLAYRVLKDEVRYEIGSAMARAVTRAAISGGVYAAMKSNENTESFAGLGSLLSTVIMDAFASNTSDSVRNWELLPAAGYIAMGQVDRGGMVNVFLGGQQHAVNMPPEARGVIIMVSQTTTSNMRVDYVAY